MSEENKTTEETTTHPAGADVETQNEIAESAQTTESSAAEPTADVVDPASGDTSQAESSQTDVTANEAGEPEDVDFDESDILGDDYVDEDEDDDEDAAPLEDLVEEAPVEDEISMSWYILKVQVNRETSICDALLRRVKVADLERFFGEILVPTEEVREFSKSGKQRIVKRKLYPGYIVVNMSINDDSWFLVRETPGIGDFTGAAGKPAALSTEEIDRIVASTKPETVKKAEETVKIGIKFKEGDRVRVKEGYFQNYEGDVSNIDERNGRVTVLINIFGRPNPVELDHWQIEDI